MSWTGTYYNTQAQVEAYVQMSLSTTSKPTLAQAEQFNSDVYCEIKRVLCGAYYPDTITDDNDLKNLAYLNTIGCAGLIQRVRHGTVSPNKSSASETWTAKYENLLNAYKTGEEVLKTLPNNYPSSTTSNKSYRLTGEIEDIDDVGEAYFPTDKKVW